MFDLLIIGRRECRHDEGSKIDFKNLCESQRPWSVKLEMYAQYRAFVYGMLFVELNIILNGLFLDYLNLLSLHFC